MFLLFSGANGKTFVMFKVGVLFFFGEKHGAFLRLSRQMCLSCDTFLGLWAVTTRGGISYAEYWQERHVARASRALPCRTFQWRLRMIFIYGSWTKRLVGGCSSLIFGFVYIVIYILPHHLGNVLRSLRRLLGDVGCLSCKTWLATDEPWQLTTDDKESWANVVMMLSFGISWASRAGVSVGGSFPLLYSLCILARCSGKLQRSFHPLAFRFGVSRAPQRLDKII